MTGDKDNTQQDAPDSGGETQDESGQQGGGEQDPGTDDSGNYTPDYGLREGDRGEHKGD